MSNNPTLAELQAIKRAIAASESTAQAALLAERNKQAAREQLLAIQLILSRQHSYKPK